MVKGAAYPLTVVSAGEIGGQYEQERLQGAFVAVPLYIADGGEGGMLQIFPRPDSDYQLVSIPAT